MSTNTLILLHAFFRHGERTPPTEHQYRNDPHKGQDFKPYGSSQLTNDGKRTMYKLGELLRTTYDEYLGDEYMPQYIDALTTDTDRSKMSLQLVLASLFPPKGANVWCENLNWQPIPYNAIPVENDDILGTCVMNPKFMKAYRENFESDQGKELLEKYHDLLAYLRKHTGEPLKTTREVWLLTGVLIQEKEFGLELPQWTAPIYPDKLKELALNEYVMQSATQELKTLILGKLLAKILNNTRAKIDGNSQCKIHLYSGHDYNLAHLLIFFGLMYPHFPKYGSCLMLEIHKNADKYGMKLRYRETKSDDLKYLTFTNGEDFLPIKDFENMANSWIH